MDSKDLTCFDLQDLYETERGRKYLDLIEREWDFKENNHKEIFPDELSINNNKINVHWKCKYGHEWDATVYNRTKNTKPTNCPYCSHPSFGEFAIYYYLKKYFNEEKDKHYFNGKHVKSRRPLKEIIDIDNVRCRLEADIVIDLPELKMIIEHNSHLYHSAADRKKSDAKKESYISRSNYSLVRFFAYKNNPNEASAEYCYREGNYTEFEIAIKRFFEEKIDKNYERKLKIDVKSDFANILNSYYPKKRISCMKEEAELKENEKRNKEKVIRRIRLACDWDYEKNGDLEIFNFAPTSNFYANWHCRDCGKTWSTTIGNRFAGRDCPDCKTQKKRNSKMEKVKPEDSFYTRCFDKTVLYWDYEKNKDINPKKIEYTSTREIHFKCGKHNRDWKSSPSQMYKLVCGCEMCGRESSAEKKFKPVYQLDQKTYDIIRKFDSQDEVKKAGFGEVIKDREGKAKYLNSGNPFRNFIWADDSGLKEFEKKSSSKPTVKKTFQEAFPEFVEKYWDWEANGKAGLYPDKITCGQGVKVFLKCKKHNCGCAPYVYSITNAFRKSAKGFRACKLCDKEQGGKASRQKAIVQINANTKEVKVYLSVKEAKEDGYTNINKYLKDGHMYKNNVLYFWIDTESEKMGENSLLYKYLKGYLD